MTQEPVIDTFLLLVRAGTPVVKRFAWIDIGFPTPFTFDRIYFLYHKAFYR